MLNQCSPIGKVHAWSQEVQISKNGEQNSINLTWMNHALTPEGTTGKITGVNVTLLDFYHKTTDMVVCQAFFNWLCPNSSNWELSACFKHIDSILLWVILNFRMTVKCGSCSIWDCKLENEFLIFFLQTEWIEYIHSVTVKKN